MEPASQNGEQHVPLSAHVSALSLNVSQQKDEGQNGSRDESELSCNPLEEEDAAERSSLAQSRKSSDDGIVSDPPETQDSKSESIEASHHGVLAETTSKSNVIFGEIELLDYRNDGAQENRTFKMILEDFYLAVDEGDAESMERMVGRYNLDVNIIFTASCEFIKRKHRGWCAIHMAASHGDLKLIQYLLSEGSDVEAVTPEGETALHIAAKHGAADVVGLLLECNVFLRDRQNNQGVTALLKAIFNSQQAFKGNYRRCVQLLLGSGCNPNISSSSKVTALHVAVDKGDSLLVSKLIDAGANVNALCDHKTSPLLRALISKHVNSEIVSKLLEAGADTRLKMNGRSMLHIAVSRCDDRIIESFLLSGADPNCKDQTGKTPLWVAVEENNIKVVPILVKGGGMINYVREPQCISLLSQAIILNSLPMVKLLLEYGATTHTETFMWSTPLHIAVDMQNVDIIIELLRANCPLNTTSNAKYAFRPMTPIRLAMELGNVEIICLLMQAGCKVQWSWLREDRISLALASKPDAVNHIRRFLSDIPSLLHLSRLTLREYMGHRFAEVMHGLNEQAIIPQKMSDYLLLRDVLD
ncbi:ankyrin-2 [Aplysia californica]|uniref:Ankyrin-2 n=1 Tax=Aplysia californica TaxID=6500 RepID=A0ABM0JJW8_APLCA|nr:ankyrin-2 [Aplysia californica]XP_005095388.1 ankyrin-2 [Aplysia californica]